MDKERMTDCFLEIKNYCEETKNYSFYDMKAYVIKNNKEEWVEALKDQYFRATVSEYLKSAKRKKNISYKTDLADAMENYIKVMVETEKDK